MTTITNNTIDYKPRSDGTEIRTAADDFDVAINDGWTEFKKYLEDNDESHSQYENPCLFLNFVYDENGTSDDHYYDFSISREGEVCGDLMFKDIDRKISFESFKAICNEAFNAYDVENIMRGYQA